MRRGYAVAWVAWEGDMLPGDGRMVLDVPVATDNGAPITGRVRVEIIVDAPPARTMPLSGRVAAHSYRTVSMDARDAVLTRRRYPYDTPEVIPPDRMAFRAEVVGAGAETKVTEHALVPSDWHIHYPAGFQPGWIYELIYTAKDPKVMGLGHVAVRDFVSFLKYDDERRQPAAGTREGLCLGPLADRPLPARLRLSRLQRRCRRAARVRRRDAACRRRRTQMDEPPVRQPDRVRRPAIRGSFQHRRSFPFSYAWSTDHLTGKEDAILKRPETDPLVFHTQTATEYWVRRGSLAHTDTHGQRSAAAGDGARLLLGQFAARRQPAAEGAARGIGQNYSNNVATSMLFRAMLDAMDRWATGRETRRRTAGSRPARTARWSITPPGGGSFPRSPASCRLAEPNALPLLDFGPDADKGILRSRRRSCMAATIPMACARTALYRAGSVGGPRRQRHSRCASADGGSAAWAPTPAGTPRPRLRPRCAMAL
jgi:hypothetical protein